MEVLFEFGGKRFWHRIQKDKNLISGFIQDGWFKPWQETKRVSIPGLPHPAIDQVVDIRHTA